MDFATKMENDKRENNYVQWRDIPAPATLEPLAERLPIRNQAGGMIYPDLFRKSWDRALKRLGLPGYNPHDLRHRATVTLQRRAHPRGVAVDGAQLHQDHGGPVRPPHSRRQ
ncbi:hypothetical protein [Streptomyces decoyicus]|uniref:hypothetical protein n=1 Tax=Streptomyces decoyicus TaxID=249567 RepID=UPI00339FB606